MIHHFTPYTAAAGGVIIGLAALLLLRWNKQICGISGIVENSLPPYRNLSESYWRFSFLLGLILGGVLLKIFYLQAMAFEINESLPFILLAGFLVGAGTRLGMGCTSGHGVCGVGRASGESMIATAIFFGVGVITASLLYLLRGKP